MPMAFASAVPTRQRQETLESSLGSQAEGLAALIALAQSLTPRSAPCKSAITVLIPARDEGVALADTLHSLAGRH